MKRLLPFFVFFAFSCAAWPQTATSSQSDKLFFPKDWYWGYAQFDIAPPHNELDPNLCASNAGQFGGVNSKCNAFARYVMSGSLELRPIGRTVARRLVVFYDPNFLFGKNVPQTLYTWAWDPIGMELKWGVGVDLPKRFQFLFTTASEIGPLRRPRAAARTGVARARRALGPIQHLRSAQVLWHAARGDGLDVHHGGTENTGKNKGYVELRASVVEMLFFRPWITRNHNRPDTAAGAELAFHLSPLGTGGPHHVL